MFVFTFLGCMLAFILFLGFICSIIDYFKEQNKSTTEVVRFDNKQITNPPAYQMTLDAIEKKKVEDFNKSLNELSSRIEQAINRGEFSIKLNERIYTYNFTKKGKFQEQIYICENSVNREVAKSIFKELRKRGFKVKHNYAKNFFATVGSQNLTKPIIETTISWDKQ